MRRKLLISFMLLIVIMMASFVYIINNSIMHSIENQYAIHFRYELNLLEKIFKSDNAIFKDPKSYIKKIEIGESSRITVIDENGVVLADNYERPERMNNHLKRPEIQDALNGDGFGTTIRYSDTLDQSFIYVVKMMHFNDKIYYIRLSEAITEIKTLSQNNIKYGLVLGLIALVVATIISWMMSKRITQPIQELIHSSDLIAKGQYNKKIYVSSKDEVGHLANSFNVMRKNLSQTMSALTTRNAELQAILNSMASGIIAVDIQENIILINQQCFDILVLSDSIVSIHDSVYKVVKNQKIIDMIKEATLNGKSFVEEVLHSHIEKTLKVHVQPIRIQNKEIMGTMIVIEDITQIKRLEGVRSEFVSNVTHELKTPLTSILGFVDTLKEGAIEDGEKARRFLSIIETEAERLNRLISDLLSLSEIENSYQEKEQTLVYLGSLIQDVIDMLAINVGNKCIDLRLVTNHEIEIEANKDRIKQLLINLIDNAIKYTEEGHVHIHLTHTKKYAQIAIEDTGIGFDSTQKMRLFERFYRIDKARSRKLGGTGLGLSIVKHIVNLYKGEISVESVMGKGSTFTVKLPISKTILLND